MNKQALVNSLIIGNKKTRIYHRKSCHHVKKEMNLSNMVELDADFKDHKGHHYRPCAVCRPFSKWFDARMEMLAEDTTLDLYNKGQKILKEANYREPSADSCIIEGVY